MTEPDDALPTLLADLSDTPLSALRRLALPEERERLIQQVERPRLNLGTGPPGRAD